MAVPPIVLFVGRQDDARGASYATVLEQAGFWVVESGSVEGAVKDAVILQPDVVIADLTRSASQRQTDALVRTLKATSGARAVPLVVLQRTDAATARWPELDPFDVVLVEPLSPVAVRNAVERVLAASRAVRRRRNVDRAVSPRVAESIAVGESKRVALPPQSAQGCPECGRLLAWTERRSVAGIVYDYFRWCESGCGLYCFGVVAGRWLKLV